MQIRPEQLGRELSRGLARCYLVSGDEPLLLQECADAIRQAARAQGCTEREIIEIDNKDGAWQALLQSGGALSLFADKKLIEVRLPSGKPGSEGSKAIQSYLELNSDDILLIIAGKIDKQSLRSKWYSALDTLGIVITIWPVRPNELPGWLGKRLKAAGLEIDRDALQLLSERVEGNLLAGVQEVEKLKLLATGSKIGTEEVMKAVVDNARYNSFTLIDTALNGDARGAVRSLRGLQAEANAPPAILWVIAREIRLLTLLDEERRHGASLGQAMQRHGVWKSRVGLIEAALNRHSANSLIAIRQIAFTVDEAIKGLRRDCPWDLLERLVVYIALGSTLEASKSRRR